MMHDPEPRDEILLLGDPRLRVKCAPVTDFGSPEFQSDSRRLILALERFREENGFGRAISGPQIGVLKRMIAVNLGEGPFMIANPEIAVRGTERLSLWDDCMSFPWLMVRLERHLEIDVAYLNERGRKEEWPGVDAAVSELLQHEVDHLDGVLAIDRALDRDSIIARSLYERQRDVFDSTVDYAIRSTIASRKQITKP